MKIIYERGDNNAPSKPTWNKELAILDNNDRKLYDLIVTPISEEVIHHIVSFTKYYGALKEFEIYILLTHKIGYCSIDGKTLQRWYARWWPTFPSL